MKLKTIIWSFIVLVFSLNSCEKPPVDWTPTFDSTDTNPYGTFILRQELEEYFPDSKIQNIKQPTYDYFNENPYSYNAHYFLIYDELIGDEFTWEEIIWYVNQGGTAFISMAANNPNLEKELGIHVKNLPINKDEKSVNLSVKIPNIENSYSFEKGFLTAYFENFNEETSEVLGYVNYNGHKEPNYLKVYYGNGYFLLHTEPYAFTNFHMLEKNHAKYVENVFSYLSPEDIIWDNHRMHRRESGEKNDGGFLNGLNFILQHESLRWAFFLLVVMGICYLVFNSKRRQRPVPILLPYPNYTLEFAKTLSELYRYHPDHTAMVKYKINSFLDQLRIHYNITPKDTAKDFTELLHAKSGVDTETCRKLVLTIDIFKSKNYLDKEDFSKLQIQIESFKHKSNNYGRTAPRK